MRNILILLVALGVAIGLYSVSKKSSQHIENYNIAVEHLKKNEFEEAIPYLEKAFKAKPNEERTLQALEEAYLETGQSDKAAKIREKLTQ